MQRYVAALKEKKAHLVDLKSHKGKQLTLQTEVNVNISYYIHFLLLFKAG